MYAHTLGDIVGPVVAQKTTARSVGARIARSPTNLGTFARRVKQHSKTFLPIPTLFSSIGVGKTELLVLLNMRKHTCVVLIRVFDSDLLSYLTAVLKVVKQCVTLFTVKIQYTVKKQIKIKIKKQTKLNRPIVGSCH